MRWTILTAMITLATGCCCTNTQLVEYQQVKVIPVKKVTPVVRRVRTAPVSCCVATRQVRVTPIVEPVLIDYVEPLDVTTTTIDFY